MSRLCPPTQGEKYLYLRPEFQPSATAARPPTGRTGAVPSQTGFAGSDRTSVGSVEDPRHSLQNRDSLTLLISDLLSPTSTTSGSNFTDFSSHPPPPSSSPSHNSSSYSVSGTTPTSGSRASESTMFSSRGTRNDVLQSHKHFTAASSATRGPVTTPTTTPSHQTTSSSAPSSDPYSSPYAATISSPSSSTTMNTATTTNSSLFGPSSSSGLGDLGLSSLGGTSSSSGLGDLMSTFDDIFSSFGTSTGTSGLGGTDMSLGELGGLSTTTSESSSKYDTPAAKSAESYSSTTTSTPQGMCLCLSDPLLSLSLSLSLSLYMLQTSGLPQGIWVYAQLWSLQVLWGRNHKKSSQKCSTCI